MADVTGEDWLRGNSWDVWWCMCFVSWCLDQGGVAMLGAPAYNTNTFYNSGGWMYEVSKYTIQYGDIIIYDWDGNTYTDHVSFSTGEYDGFGFPTVEGNVDGNRVATKYRTLDGVAHVLRPHYA
jgi:hypothetical protein